MMNEEDFAKRWVAVLDRSLGDLRPEVISQLTCAREAACQRAAQQLSSHQNGASHTLSITGWVRQHRVGAVGALLTMLMVLAIAMWQYGGNTDDDTADVDAGLLTGDLPVNAYLDNHLNKWTNGDSGN